jgi:DNA replication protein DnaC
MQLKAASKIELDFERVLAFINRAIEPAYLNKVQELILRDTFEGKTYSQIASAYCYESEYIKTVGCELWQLLSKCFERQINKANFAQFIRTQTDRNYFYWNRDLVSNYEIEEKTTYDNQECDWGVAPRINNFIDRKAELTKLIEWIEEERCNLVFVSGTTGIGKTTLVVKFVEEVQQNFQYIIWRSLQYAPSLDTLLDNLVYFFTKDKDSDEQLVDNLDSKILKLLSYLNRHRCLLILDDLNFILDKGERRGKYRQNYQNYRDFLDSLINARHQSAIVAIGWEKPIEPGFYKQERIHHLKLRAPHQTMLEQIFKKQLSNKSSQQEWILLWERYGYNPKPIEIATSTIETFFDGNVRRFLEQRSILLSNIREILDKQFDRLTNLEKKIAYLLAINCTQTTTEQIKLEFVPQFSSIDILESLKNLEQIGFLHDRRSTYTLSAIAQDYLKSKLFETVCEKIN